MEVVCTPPAKNVPANLGLSFGCCTSQNNSPVDSSARGDWFPLSRQLCPRGLLSARGAPERAPEPQALWLLGRAASPERVAVKSACLRGRFTLSSSPERDGRSSDSKCRLTVEVAEVTGLSQKNLGAVDTRLSGIFPRVWNEMQKSHENRCYEGTGCSRNFQFCGGNQRRPYRWWKKRACIAENNAWGKRMHTFDVRIAATVPDEKNDLAQKAVEDRTDVAEHGIQSSQRAINVRDKNGKLR